MHVNRLTVVGGRLRSILQSDWLTILAGRHAELLELGPRFVCSFETPLNPLPAVQNLSRSHPGLVFLLDYETGRCKGLAKAKAGRLTHYRIRY